MGVAWYDPMRDEAIALLVPLNWLAGWARRAWIASRIGPHDIVTEACAKARSAGFNSGYTEGWKYAFAHLDRELTRVIR